MKELVSVIVPVYNGSKYLASFFSMIEKQTYPYIEIIMVDDGSTDDTWLKLKEYKSRKFNYRIFREKNSGVSVARNLGMEHASGDFLFFIDSDDKFESVYIEKMVQSVDKYNVQFVSCGYTEFIDNAGEKFCHSNTLKGESLDDAISGVVAHHGICSALWNKVFLKSIIQENHIEFNNDIAVGEDLLFIIKYISCIDRWREIDDVLYHYQINSLGTMQNFEKAKHFNENWLTEWKALDYSESVLKSSRNGFIFNFQPFRDKRIRVSLKLLSRIRKYKFITSYSKIMKNYIRKNIFYILFYRKYSLKQKIKAIVFAI